jgi:hypothetical protein
MSVGMITRKFTRMAGPLPARDWQNNKYPGSNRQGGGTLASYTKQERFFPAAVKEQQQNQRVVNRRRTLQGPVRLLPTARTSPVRRESWGG